MWWILFKIGITLGLVIPVIALINLTFGGQYADRLNSDLAVAMLVPLGLIIAGFIGLMWTE